MNYTELKNKLSEIETLIKTFEEKKKLFLKFLKSDDSQIKEIYNKNFAVKIITNGKIDPKNYEKKLSKIEGMIKKCKDVREEIVDESLVKKLTKLENMFERLSKFIDAYENVVKDFKRGNLEQTAAKLQLKKLEQNEISIALKDANSLFLALKNEQDIEKIFSLASKRNHSETNRVIPTLGVLFRNLFTSSTTSYKLKTPFDEIGIQVKLLQNAYGIEFMIYCGGKEWTYNYIVNKLDPLFVENDRDDVISLIINTILMYLKGNKNIENEIIRKYQEEAMSKNITSERKDKIINEILAMFTYTPTTISSLKISAPNSRKDVISAAASLSGILVLAEACQYRNPTFGKIERNAIKSVLTLAKKGCRNPFGKVFNNQKGWYIPARDGGNMDTQLLLSYNFDNDSVKARFLPLPRKDEANNLIKKLLLLENEETLIKIKDKCDPYDWKKFFENMKKGNLDDHTIDVVFTKFKTLFPSQELVTSGDFIKLPIRKKGEIVMKIKQYKPTEKSEQENISEFVEFIKNEASIMNIKGKIEKMIANFGIQHIIKQLKSSEMKDILPVRIYDLCYCESNEYISLDDLPELAANFLEPPANNSGLNLKEYMRDKVDKGLRKFYKSQNQVLTKEQIKNLILQI